DVIVGAYSYDNGQTDEGRAYVYHGSSSGLSATANWTAESDQEYANFGCSVSTAGDVNGDGYSDVIVGAYYYDNVETDEGRAFTYYGNGGKSILSRPMQFRNNKYTPIVPVLKTRSTSDMVIGLVPNSFFCRGLAKLQVEVKQLGTPFNNSNMSITPNWYAIGLYNNEIKIHITGLQDKTLYKWRARLMYDMTDGTPQRYSRWFYGPGGRGLACFQVSNDDNPLPVQLRSFTGEAKVNNILLDWVTIKEYNNAGFQVENMKADAYSQNWESRGFVQSIGNTNEPTEYKFEDRNKSRGVYLYRLKQIDLNGNYHYYYLNSSISIGVPGKFELSQNYPNPFNPTTKITFSLPNDSRVTLKVYDISGREMKTLINGEVKTADWYTVEFSGAGLSSGVYFYRLIADGINKYTTVKKMMLIK
ncbi:MAG: T9SS type A sorting domain-containing protein, partial [Ignavibacteria bacterium]|nr:T9SS type A sorting domain-containing protein [Ignavibacteria bacterium]